MKLNIGRNFTTIEAGGTRSPQAARDRFAWCLDTGGAAFGLWPNGRLERVYGLDPAVPRIVLIPRLAGGAVPSGDRAVITAAGLARLELELQRLREVERSRLADRMRDARESPGDPGDNLELLEAQRDFALLEARISALERSLAQARVVETPHGDSADVGSVLVVRDDEGEEDTFTLVGPAEADPRLGLISIASPVGEALLGARVGDERSVETPSGPRRLKVLKLS